MKRPKCQGFTVQSEGGEQGRWGGGLGSLIRLQGAQEQGIIISPSTPTRMKRANSLKGRPDAGKD